jgi:DNA polymerase-3 subunit epsilon
MKFEDIIAQPIDEAVYAVLDVETTGLGPANNNIIEIGIVKVRNGKKLETFHSLVNPARNIPYFITQFTGISDDDVYNAPMFDEISDKILDFLDDCILIGHNLQFDISFMRKEFRLCGVDKFNPPQICTCKLARRIFPALKSKSLASVAQFMKIHNENAHRALSDAEVTSRIFNKMLSQLKKEEHFITVEEVINHQYSPNTKIQKTVVKKQLSSQFAALPDAPGVYYFINSKNQIIYIGKAKSIRDRIRSYISDSAPNKTKKILKQAVRIKTEITNSELTALLAEAEAIKIINPKLNVQLKKYNNKYFLKINRTHISPNTVITNHFDFDGNDYFGLFINKRKAEQIKDLLDKIFMLRECDDKEFLKKKACFLAEIERCTAPCTNHADESYKYELEKVYEFMYGRNQFALNRMINKMKDFSQQLKFEKAAEIKQIVDLILSQIHKTSLLAEPINSANVLIEISENNFNKDYLLMLEGKIYIKKNILKECDEFELALDDFFSGTLKLDNIPSEEDLEKMKITLNWIVKNRNKVRIYYLKEYKSKKELFTKASRFVNHAIFATESTFDLKDLANKF